MSENKSNKVLHIAKIVESKGEWLYLLLRQTGDQQYSWLEFHNESPEIPSSITGSSIEEAIRLARTYWQRDSFQTVNCGFRYTLPERDEHGSNALFHQMAASYSTSNGIYFDADLGNNCFVNFASDEARSLWKTLTKLSRA